MKYKHFKQALLFKVGSIINKGGELVKAPRLLRMFCKFLFK